ncbi:30S ribosome-binding factor [Buchnera aphidicola (Thelaxes suberi)]
MKNFRSHRISSLLKKELSCIVQRYIRDPRIDYMITVSEVNVSKDLSHAKIFITLFNNTNVQYNNQFDKKMNQILRILNCASGYIRCLIAKKINIRISPNLKFYFDNSLKYGETISNIINKNKINNQYQNL